MGTSSDDTIAALKASGLCASLSDEAVRHVAAEGTAVSFARGERVFNEQSDANRVFLIVRGVVRVETLAPSVGDPGLVLDHLASGRLFGEVGLLDEEPRSAAAICEEDALLFSLSRADLERLTADDPATAAKIYLNISRDLCRKLRGANDELREIRASSAGRDAKVVELAEQAERSARMFAAMTQEKIDRIARAVAEATAAAAERLAMEELDETGMGRAQDKAQKLRFVAETVASHVASLRTAGVVARSEARLDLALPSGPLASLPPVTSPTAVSLYHALLAVKTRNAVVFSFPERACESGAAAVRMAYEAALDAGAPEHCLSVMPGRVEPTRMVALLRQPEIRLVLASGGPSLMRMLRSLGKPVLWDGVGCTPAYVHEDASPAQAAEDIALSKTFDGGTSFASEQVVVVHAAVLSEFLGELAVRGAALLGEEARLKLVPLLFPTGTGGPVDGCGVLGRSATDIASAAGFAISSASSLIVCRLSSTALDEPLAGVKLSPVLGLRVVESTEEALAVCREVLSHGGLGHTAVIHTASDALVDLFAASLPVGRVLVNCPATFGAVGGLLTDLVPSLTLGTGTLGGDLLSGNLEARHLIELRHVVRRVERRS